jgi:hypothetical protein
MARHAPLRYPCRMSDESTRQPPANPLSDAARRALAEAAERRAAQEAREAELARMREIKGRGGKDPVRYEDWEVKGIASDF